MPTPPRKATQSVKDRPPRRFVFLLLDNFTMLAFASAIEPLRIANRVAGTPIYSWALAGENGREAVCSNGASFRVDMGLEDIDRDDILLVCGGIDVQKSTTKAVLNWLRRVARPTSRYAAFARPRRAFTPRRGTTCAATTVNTG